MEVRGSAGALLTDTLATGEGDSGRTGAAPAVKTAGRVSEPATVRRIDQKFAHYQEDAPVCDVCGSLTVRNGNCYKCFNCGSSLGCS